MRIINNVIIFIKLILHNQWLECIEKTKIVFVSPTGDEKETLGG